jgi:ADP-heptose:LPS heptosyltransferase
MLRRLWRKIRTNPFDALLKKAKRKKCQTVLLAWNRGLGDIALGLFAMIHRIHYFLPKASITFLIREDLKEGFELLYGVKTIVAPNWKRGEEYNVQKTLKDLGVEAKHFDLVIEKPDPTYWVKWQLGKFIPKLEWNPSYEDLHEDFSLPKDKVFIGVQIHIETNYSFWRNWPLEKWHEFFDRIEMRKDVKILLFGLQKEPFFPQKCIIDLRGKTSLFEMLSIIKNRCSYVILPDTGTLSMVYFLNENFPLHVISLWGNVNQGILKQNVSSPNLQLKHTPIVAENGDLSLVSVDDILMHIFPQKNAKKL